MARITWLAFLISIWLSTADTEKCYNWDLSSISVPIDFTFRPKKNPGYVAFDSDHENVRNYWDNIRLASNRDGMKGKLLHEAVHLPGTGREAIFESFKTIPKNRGLFIYLRGDSHLRTMQSLMTINFSRDKKVVQGANYNKGTYHLPHLLCCPRSGISPIHPFMNCSNEISIVNGVDSTKDPEGFDQAVLNRTHSNGGSLCILWEMLPLMWNYQQNDLNQATILNRWGAENSPDLVVINTGAHYTDQINIKLLPPGSRKYHETIQGFEADAPKFIKQEVEIPLNNGPITNTKAFFFLSSPKSWASDWSSQIKMFETLRSLIINLPPKVREKTSYFDMHTLWGFDKCGYSRLFPYRYYQFVNESDRSQVYLFFIVYYYLL